MKRHPRPMVLARQLLIWWLRIDWSGPLTNPPNPWADYRPRHILPMP